MQRSVMQAEKQHLSQQQLINFGKHVVTSGQAAQELVFDAAHQTYNRVNPEVVENYV